jgi:transcriptional regulator NrdR family protein
MPAVQVACESCGSRRTVVVLTQQVPDAGIVRRRRCDGCGHRWYTLQQAEVAISPYSLVWQGSKRDCRIVALKEAV